VTTVVDASVAVRWMIEMIGSDRARDLLHQEQHLIAPDLVLAELANAAWKSVVFERLALEPLADAIASAEKAFSELIPSAHLKNRALSIAIALKHPVYDCFYLALAQERECVLATFDARLIRRCANSAYSHLVRSV
jgi:predicted nucleic acid-binding protein